MKYIKNPLTYQFIKNKFIENNIPFNRESLFYFSNEKQLVIDRKMFQLFQQNTEILNDLILELVEDFKKGIILNIMILKSKLRILYFTL